MRKLMAVCTCDPLYAKRLAEFGNRRFALFLHIVSFSAPDRLREFAAEHGVDILLTDYTAEDAIGEGIGCETVYLSDGDAGDKEQPSVYKFQPADEVIRAALGCCKNLEDSFVPLGKRGRVTGVYSPVGRCLKTSFCLTLGQMLARNEKVLYVSLEDCSGLAALLGGEREDSLSDILYAFRQGSLGPFSLSAAVHTWGSLSYIPPVRRPEDLLELCPSEFGALLEKLSSECGYDHVVVDVGQMGRSAAEILECCGLVYMPVREDAVSRAKLEEFQRYLQLSGHAGLEERIRRLRLPGHLNLPDGGSYADRLLWSELGDYVRELLKGSCSGRDEQGRENADEGRGSRESGKRWGVSGQGECPPGC